MTLTNIALRNLLLPDNWGTATLPAENNSCCEQAAAPGRQLFLAHGAPSPARQVDVIFISLWR